MTAQDNSFGMNPARRKEIQCRQEEGDRLEFPAGIFSLSRNTRITFGQCPHPYPPRCGMGMPRDWSELPR